VRFLAAVILGFALASPMLARESGFGEYRAVRESLSLMPARFQGEWLQKRGLDASRYTEYRRPETTGLRLVGKWGRGPSNEVTGRGNLVALTLGSEVALLDFAKPDSPVVLSEIQLNFIPRQTALHDSFLLTCGNGIEIWNIADSTHPVYRNVIPYGVGDFASLAELKLFQIEDRTREAEGAQSTDATGTFVTRLRSCAPNPFGGATAIDYELGHAGPVALSVHDVSGRLVRRLESSPRPAGRYIARWDGTDAAVVSFLLACTSYASLPAAKSRLDA